MLLKEIWLNLNTYVNQDGTDDYFGLDDFNRTIRNELRNFVVDVLDEEQDNPYEKRPMSNYLLDSLSNTDGEEDLPSDYLRAASAAWVPTSGVTEPIDIIDKKEFMMRNANLLSPPMYYNKVCYIENGVVYFKPDFSSGGTAYLFFYRDPVIDTENSEAPFLDYYINLNKETVFLDEGDDRGLITSGTYRNGASMASTTGTCETHELDIPVEFHVRFFERFIERLGLKDRDQLAITYGGLKEQQEAQRN